MEEKQQEYQKPIKEQSIGSEQEPHIEEGVPKLENEEALNLDKESKPEVEPIGKEQKPEKKTEKERASAPSIPSGKIQQQTKHLMGLDKENQIKVLCDLSSQKGIDFAIEAAKNLNNAYVLDEFHDALIDVDELHEKLIERGDL